MNPGGKHTSTNAGNSNTLANNEYDEYNEHDDDYDDEQEQQHQEQQHQQLQQQQHQLYQHQYRPQSNAANVEQRFKHYSRVRRDAVSVSDAELATRMKCNRAECAYIRCTTSQLDADSSAWIAIRMRLVAQTANVVCRMSLYSDSSHHKSCKSGRTLYAKLLS